MFFYLDMQTLRRPPWLISGTLIGGFCGGLRFRQWTLVCLSTNRGSFYFEQLFGILLVGGSVIWTLFLKALLGHLEGGSLVGGGGGASDRVWFEP